MPQISFQHLLDCPVCMDSKHTPKLLPCQHTVCVKCIDSLQRVARNTIACPMCRHSTVLPMNGHKDLPTNLTLVQLKDTLSSYNNSLQQSEKICEFCEESGTNVTHLCNDCNDFFCESCAKKHQTKKHFVKHSLVPMKIISCAKHQKYFSFFCMDCRTLLCTVCLHRDVCSNHKVSSIEEIKSSKLKELDETISKIADDIKGTIAEVKLSAPNTSELTKGLSPFEEEKSKVKQQAKILREKLDTREKELIGVIEKYENKYIKMQEYSLKLNERVKLLQSLQETAQAIRVGGIQQMLLILPTIQASMPTKVEKCNDELKQVTFVSKDSFDIGDIYFLNTEENNVCNADINRYTLAHAADGASICASKVWKKTDIGDAIEGVAFTLDGIALAYCVYTEKHYQCGIYLLDIQGQLLEHSLIGFHQQQPMGIAYNHIDSTLIVSYNGHLVIFNAVTLIKKTKMKLQGMSHPTSVAVMSDGNIVVTDIHSRKVVVFMPDGKPWGLYTRSTPSLSTPLYVMVDKVDNIYIGGFLIHFTKLTKTGDLCMVMEIENDPQCSAVHGDFLIVGTKKHGVRVFAHNGKRLGCIPQEDHVCSIAVMNGKLAVVTKHAHVKCNLTMYAFEDISV